MPNPSTSPPPRQDASDRGPGRLEYRLRLIVTSLSYQRMALRPHSLDVQTSKVDLQVAFRLLGRAALHGNE